jgi:hypothetical protein
MMRNIRKAEINLEFQNYIEQAPVGHGTLLGQATANDAATLDKWENIWFDHYRMNKEKYGPFKDRSIGKFYHGARHKPVIIAGAGPSLKHNVQHLKNKRDITLVSCLHNFHFLEDNGVETDFYVTLDAGEVTVEEVYEGGAYPPEHYWELTKKRTLLAYCGTHPRLLEKWQGEIYFYNAPVPIQGFIDECNKIETFNCWLGSGGNVLGACLYFAKAFLGAGVIGFVGADFSFSAYGDPRKFHSWNSKYDQNLGHVVKCVDVYGNKVLSWQSYQNFKAWFDYICSTKPGIYYNCTEGGTLGAYVEGNIMSVVQIELENFIKMFNLYEEIGDQVANPETAERKLLF